MKKLKKKIKTELALFFESFIMGIVKLSIIILIFLGLFYIEFFFVMIIGNHSKLVNNIIETLDSYTGNLIYSLIPFVITKLIANRFKFLHIKKIKDTKKDIF
jgi:hypothetical protein